MTPPLTLDWARLTAYLDGTASPDERIAFEAWIESRPEHARVVAAVQRIWTMSASPAGVSSMQEVALPRMWENVTWSMKHSRSASASHTPTWWHRIANRGLIAAAAGGIVALLVMTNRSRTPSATYTHRYATKAGERASVTFTDGSRAILAPMTTLTVTTGSSAGMGTAVVLSGEALFTVSHHTRSPFLVRTGNTTARVLGTTFSVRRYATDHAARIMVIDGRVAVRNAILTARTLGMVSDSGPVTVIPNVAVDDYTTWTTGQLVFHDTPVRDMVADLSRAYDVDIRLADSVLADRKLTWRVPVASRSLQDVLNGLGVLLNSHYTRAGRIITLLPGRAALARPLPAHQSLTSELQYGRK